MRLRDQNVLRETGTSMRTVRWFVIGVCAVSGSSAQADLNVTYSYGLANGIVHDILSYTIGWWDADYGVTGTPYGAPVSGSVDYTSGIAGQTFHVASEVGMIGGTLYTKAHAESSGYWGGGFLGTPSTSSWAHGAGAIQFTLDSAPLSLQWSAQNLDAYQDSSWRVDVDRLTRTPEGSWTEHLWETNSSQTGPTGMTLIPIDSAYLNPAYIYQVSWEMGVTSYLSPGDHGWAQFDLVINPVPLPGAVLLGCIGLSVAGWRLKRQME